MTLQSLFRFCFCLLAALLQNAYASSIRYPNIDGLGDTAIGYQVLQLALKKAGSADQPVISQDSVNQERAKIQLRDGDLDVYDAGPSVELDALFDPIYRPIDRGVLGWRLFIINKDNAAKFAAIKKLDDLRAYVAGQGQGWNDIKTLEGAGLQVTRAPNIENLVKMVEGKRFDFFPLGANEVFGILDQFGKGSAHLEVEKTVTLVYPWARFFFVKKGNAKLKADITKGMDIALQDGSLQALLNTHVVFKDAFSKANLKGRTPIRIASPDLPAGFANIPPAWWFDPSK